MSEASNIIIKNVTEIIMVGSSPAKCSCPLFTFISRQKKCEEICYLLCTPLSRWSSLLGGSRVEVWRLLGLIKKFKSREFFSQIHLLSEKVIQVRMLNYIFF